MIGIALSFVVAIAIIGFTIWYFRNKQLPSSDSKNVSSKIVDGKTELDNPVILPTAYNQKEGISFTYTCWLRFNGFEYRYGEQKVIFIKGNPDLSSMCPGVFLDANTNTILVKIDTFGAQEVIPIPNIPAKKWLHFAISVDQDSVDVYINGILHTHKTLTQLPKQNTRSVQTGINGGFDGSIADLKYYNYYTPPDSIPSLVGSPPDSTDVANFRYDWWTGS